VSNGGYGFASNQDSVAAQSPLIIQPNEKRLCSFSFTTLPLATGEYVASIVSTNYSPDDDATEDRTLITNVEIGPGTTPNTITFQVNQPVDQQDYLVTIVITTAFTGTSGASQTLAAVFWVQGRAA